MESLDQVATALRAGDYPSALGPAIAAWRETRSVELADLIDRITTRCTPPKPPHTQAATHRWWMALATNAPDPLTLGGLIATLPIRMHVETDVAWETMRARWPESNPIIAAIEAVPEPAWVASWKQQGVTGDAVRWPRVSSWVDRLAAMIRWPDDPRLSRVFVELLANPDVRVYEANQGITRAIADRLIALADRRVAPWLAELVVEPNRATSKQTITNPLALEISAAIPEATPAEPTRIAACVARLPSNTPPETDLEPLWRQVAEDPDNDAPRLVLADALIAADDNRGELIALQCVTDPARRGHAQTQAHRLVHKEWQRWMGDLALVLARKGTEMRRGMLEKVRIGLSATPPWAWDTVRGHRELVTVREVRPAEVTPPTFAKFVAQLERFPRMLGLDGHEVIEELAKLRDRVSLEEAFYSPTSTLVYYRRTRAPFETVFHALARLAPDLERLELGIAWWVGGELHFNTQLPPRTIITLLEYLPAMFRKLRTVRIRSTLVPEDARPDVGALPFVELTD